MYVWVKNEQKEERKGVSTQNRYAALIEDEVQDFARQDPLF
jgi:hypothetical protein